MVLDYLKFVVECDDTVRKEQADELTAPTKRLARDMSAGVWTRDDFYNERLGRLRE